MRPELVRTPGGIPLDELSLHGERVEASELRATPETLRLQADVARAAGRSQLADNLLRASELAGLPDETILEIYTALRPGRSTAAELEGWAEQLESRDAGRVGGVRSRGSARLRGTRPACRLTAARSASSRASSASCGASS